MMHLMRHYKIYVNKKIIDVWENKLKYLLEMKKFKKFKKNHLLKKHIFVVKLKIL